MVWKDVGSKTRKMLHPRGILKKNYGFPPQFLEKENIMDQVPGISATMTQRKTE